MSTESEIRQKVISTAKAWLGRNEADGSHREIINIYNAIRPLPVGYKLSYNDYWCAGYVSAVGQKLSITDIILPECSCDRMIAKYKAAGRWQESDAYSPQPADIVIYDWQDDGAGDNTGSADHVGFVVSNKGTTMQIIEGNISNKVGYRTLSVNGRYIRGYCLPDYARANVPVSGSQSADKAPESSEEGTYILVRFTRDVQAACGASVDGLAGPETLSKTVTLSATINNRHAAVKAVQRRLAALGYTEVGEADGIAGPLFTAAVKHYQKDHGCIVDGEITKRAKTWRKLLCMD